MNKIELANFEISNNNQFILIAGPCVIESEKHSLMMAEKIANICQKKILILFLNLVLIKQIDPVLIVIEEFLLMKLKRSLKKLNLLTDVQL